MTKERPNVTENARDTRENNGVPVAVTDAVVVTNRDGAPQTQRIGHCHAMDLAGNQ